MIIKFDLLQTKKASASDNIALESFDFKKML